jgi:hypothetical protein
MSMSEVPAKRRYTTASPRYSVPREQKVRGDATPDSVVRMARAIKLLGLDGEKTARIIGVGGSTLSAWVRNTERARRRMSAGQPSDEEIYEAGRIVAKWAIHRRKKK